MTKNNPIYLRAHHLLCLQGYQGYGYDEKFKKNMDKVFYQLNINNNNIKNNYNNYNDNEDKDNENKENQRFSNSKMNIKNIIILTDYPDDLCSHCPNLIDDKCAGEISDQTSMAKNTEKINSNNKKIIKMDQLVLQKAKLEKNVEYSIDEAISSVNKAFDDVDKAKKSVEIVNGKMNVYGSKQDFNELFRLLKTIHLNITL